MQDLQLAAPLEIKPKSNDPGPAHLTYTSTHIFSYIEGAEEHGILQESVPCLLSEDACELIPRLKVSRFKTRYEAGSTLLLAVSMLGLFNSGSDICNGLFGQPAELSRAPVCSAYRRGWSPRHQPKSRESPQCEMLDILLENEAEVSLRSRFLQTALHTAAIKSPDSVMSLSRKKPNVNAQDINGEMPLHRAVQGVYYAQIVKLLLSHGARVDTQDSRRKTLLDLARSSGFP